MSAPSSSNLIIKTASFEEILPLWRDQLWPDRQSTIEPLSMIDSQGRIDLGLRELALLRPPVFFKLTAPLGSPPVGCQGIQRTGLRETRLRGLWVAPELRGQGWGRRLVETALEDARTRGENRVWVMARSSAEDFYAACGLRAYDRVTGYEYGPHVLMERRLRQEFAQSI